jgi:hypothetical protein
MAQAAFCRVRGRFRADAMYAITAIFGLPLLVAAGMIDPNGLHLRGLLNYTAIMLVLMPFAGGWQLLVTQLIVPTAGRSRLAAVVNLWLGGTFVAVAAIWFILSVLSYPRPDARIDPTGHLLVPYAPKTGLAIGLFALCMLLSSGCWGAIAPILRPQVALSGALISGCVFFGIVYAGGWLLVLT